MPPTATTGSRLSVLESEMHSMKQLAEVNQAAVLELVKQTTKLTVNVRVLTWIFGLAFPALISGIVYLGVSFHTAGG